MELPGGMEKGLMDYCLNPELIKTIGAHNLKLHNFLDRHLIREGTDQVFVENDFATTLGPLVSPPMFGEFCLPIMKERVKNIKKYREKVLMHSCGNSWKLLDMIVEAGIDCYQSLQTGAGMDMRLLKEKYGDRMSFWGGGKR